MEKNVRLAGEAGQGLQVAAALLGKALTRSGLHVYSYNDAESRIRGGLNFNHVRCSAGRRRGVVGAIDLLVALSEPAARSFVPLLGESGRVAPLEDWGGFPATSFSLGKIASEAGNPRVAGTAGVAAACRFLGVKREVLAGLVKERFKGDLLDANLKAVELAWEAAGELEGDQPPVPEEKGEGRLWLSGAQAVALGAVAGGARFMAAYPMSPATGVMVNLARWSERAGVAVVQAEDEIAAVNMVAGASYAGARALTATSGGGVALMCEGLSLIGMIEVPAVFVVAQRPGPATGLPTRQAQGDLHMVMNAGHGFFPRMILAPRTIEESFRLTARAFDLAEKYQVPVIVLTDQLLHDSHASVEPFDVSGLPAQRYFLSPSELEAMEEYNRYADTESGVSPMAAPGVSRHTVVADSDEHDEAGHMVEAADKAARMASKRLRKASTVAGAVEPPRIDEPPDGKPLVLTWGSTCETAREAVERLQEDGARIAHVSLRWLWPPPVRDLEKLLSSASRVVVVENNADGQLERYLRETTGLRADALVNKLDGRPFSVEELVERIGQEAA